MRSTPRPYSLFASIRRTSVAMNTSRSFCVSGAQQAVLRALHAGEHAARSAVRPFGVSARAARAGRAGLGLRATSPRFSSRVTTSAVVVRSRPSSSPSEPWSSSPRNGERREQAVLHRRDVAALALLEEQRVVDLMQAPDQEAGPRPQRQARLAALGGGCARGAEFHGARV